MRTSLGKELMIQVSVFKVLPEGSQIIWGGGQPYFTSFGQPKRQNWDEVK